MNLDTADVSAWQSVTMSIGGLNTTAPVVGDRHCGSSDVSRGGLGGSGEEDEAPEGMDKVFAGRDGIVVNDGENSAVRISLRVGQHRIEHTVDQDGGRFGSDA